MLRLKSEITRRDFMNGVALSVAAGALSPSALLAGDVAPYPPAATGLRGAHAGSFETAHAVAWEGRQWPRPDRLTDSIYDLVVVGAGLSGLAAAHLFRERAQRKVKILILDNHDDFGGHAKRNEFEVDGRLLIGYGGSQSIDGPAGYSPEARALLSSIGVETSKFYDYFDQEFYARRNMRAAIHFDTASFGKSALTGIPFGFWGDTPSKDDIKSALRDAPIAVGTKKALERLVLKEKDYLAGLSVDEKIQYLRGISFEEYLRSKASAPDELITILRRVPHGLWGCGWDVLSALEGARWGMPGTSELGIERALSENLHGEEPYIFHFPDGNASLARLLVRKLNPAAMPGSTIEDAVLARADYTLLDAADADTRIRLGATAVEIRHSPTGKSADVVYVKEGSAHRVRGRHVVMAGYMAMSPYICPEMPPAQVEAVRRFTKIPLVYANVALRNWRAFEKAGIHRVYAPGGFFETMALDFPVSIGDYKFADSADEPIILHLQHVPTAPGEGLDEKDQHRMGRRRLYALSYDDFESAIVDQLTDMLSGHGFDAERDIAGITVNRWPHGYAYEYNELFDGPDYSPSSGPHVAARASIGRISFANSDTSAYAYVNGAFDAAHRAVEEQLKIPD